MVGDVLLLAREHLSGRRGLQQLFYGRQQLLLQRMNRKAHPAGGKIFHVFALAAGDGIDVDERRAGDSGFGGGKPSRLGDE